MMTIKYSVNLDVVEQQRKVDASEEMDHVEEVNMVFIPKSRHGESECKQAKEVELKKIKDFGTYMEVEDRG